MVGLPTYGNYRLVRLLGTGGFAQVYLAEQIHLCTPVAVKLLSSKFTTAELFQLRDEIHALMDLSHPNIVRLLDYGFEHNRPFLAMEYASGGSLRDRHPQGSSLPLATVVSCVQQIASALDYAHEQKLIHRDVKPENMLVGADGTLLLSDFGIVTAAHSTASIKTIDASGTVPYMAPEQIKGKPRPASDQYALAVVAYEWLCGERPFLGNAPIEIAMKQLSEKPPSLRAKGVALPAQVEQVLMRALAKDPHQRFVSVKAFATALQKAAGIRERIPWEESTVAATPGPWASITEVALAPHQPKEAVTFSAILDRWISWGFSVAIWGGVFLMAATVVLGTVAALVVGWHLAHWTHLVLGR